MEQFLIAAFPYFAWLSAAFCLWCLVVVIRNGRIADKAIAETERSLAELRNVLNTRNKL